jgi:hypothetical protein
VLASNVSTCGMTYTSGATERSGLVRLEVTLSREGESIALDYEVMVGNVP